jgi:hypothetical protein
MKAPLLRMLAGLRHRPDDEPLSEYELEMTVRNLLYGERGASLDVTPATSQRGGAARPSQAGRRLGQLPAG